MLITALIRALHLSLSRDLERKGWEFTDRIGLAQDRYRWRALVKAVVNLRATECTTGGLSNSAKLHTTTPCLHRTAQSRILIAA
jgi:hypothetical protein